MAIKTIKEIIDSRGYVINSKDRAIFETGDLRSFFGLSNNDAIEFIVYDSSDNQLPQGEDGKLVRYIPLTNQNISDYILIPEGTLLQKYSLPNEYFIDVERLLNEAGYGNGIFKTQITLINKRAGSEMKDDKLYINEISPSRTEVRLFPVMRSNSDAVKFNLQERFNIFLKDGTFRDDVIARALEYVEQIQPNQISTLIISKYGEGWLNAFKSEYKVTDFESLMAKVHSTFIKSCIYEFTDKISDITDVNYGKPKGIQQPLSLNPADIKKRINELLIQSLNKYIAIPSVRITTAENRVLESKDDIQRVLQRKESDLLIDTTPPVKTVVEVKKKAVEEKTVVYEKKVEKQKPPVEEKQPTQSIPTDSNDEKKTTPTSPTNSSGGGGRTTKATYVVTGEAGREYYNPSLAYEEKNREAQQ
jgi:hypothetical protein